MEPLREFSNTPKPTINGPVSEGHKVTATMPAMEPAGRIDVGYEWMYADSPEKTIGTGPTYYIYAHEVGRRLMVRAHASARNFVPYKSESAPSEPVTDIPVPVTPAPVVFRDEENTAQDTYTIPATEGVDYIVGGRVLPAGTFPGRGTVTVSARPSRVWVVAPGATSEWTKEYKTPISTKYATPGTAALLGQPTAAEVVGLRNFGTSRSYERGAIVWSLATGAHVSMGGIRTTWRRNAAEYGQLGYPTSEEITGLRNGGVLQYYQGGAIVWSPASGSQVSMGGIRATWLQNQAEKGQLGYPTSQEVTGLRDGGVLQYYQGGAIVWSPASGSQVSMGGIRATWLQNQAEKGQLGYPTSREATGLRDGGVLQYYQGGAIVWSPASGSQVSMGAIRTAWAGTGYENGRLGYPTSREYSFGGGVAQDYQGGRITWVLGQGASVH
ncbi:hypothetical protein [Arthrobacter sp. UYCu712]|uniref:hypothetical protein n=1 Tax=Arthrobacter sp. UYCu712 TaxID=3156340 RepID=UPI003395AB0D